MRTAAVRNVTCVFRSPVKSTWWSRSQFSLHCYWQQSTIRWCSFRSGSYKTPTYNWLCIIMSQDITLSDFLRLRQHQHSWPQIFPLLILFAPSGALPPSMHSGPVTLALWLKFLSLESMSGPCDVPGCRDSQLDESDGRLSWSVGCLASELWAWAQTVCKLEKLASRALASGRAQITTSPSSPLPITIFFHH